MPDQRSVPAIGLAGLSLAFERGLDIRLLSKLERQQVMHHGLHALNELPWWYDRVLDAFPDDVTLALQRVLRLEWDSVAVGHRHVLRFGYHQSRTAHLIRRLATRLLKRRVPANEEVLHSNIDVLARGRARNRSIARVLEVRVGEVADGDSATLAKWVRAWTLFSPGGAATWLVSPAHQDRARFKELVPIQSGDTRRSTRLSPAVHGHPGAESHGWRSLCT